MAQIHFQPPDPLDFKNPEDWPRWKQRFEQFRVASGLVDQDAKKQVSTLLYCLGEQAETVLASTNITEEQRKVYDTVIGKFDSFFKVTRNVIFERARFNRRVQLEGESSEQFIVELYNLVEFCNYGELASEMIRDRLDAFAKKYNFNHITSSPLFPQSNGQVERAVQTVKRLLQQSDDPYMALLTYRSTPLPWCNFSPSELLMGRQLRTTLPTVPDKLTPSWPYLNKFQELNEQFKQRQKADYDRRHRTHPLPPIPNDTEVWITSGTTPSPGRVTSHASAPRSYIVETPQGEIRRNRLHLNVMPNGQSSVNNQSNTSPENRNRPVTRLATGTAIRPPDRLRY